MPRGHSCLTKYWPPRMRELRVAIVQPAVPHYRVPFFARLQAEAAKKNVRVDVFAGAVPSELASRRDVSHQSFVQQLATRELRLGSRSLFLKSLRPVARGSYDLVVMENAVRNVETYVALLAFGGRRLAFWGHGRTYTKQVSRTQQRLKDWLVRRGSWFFGYTEGGVRWVVEHGADPRRTTILNNAIDTRQLRSDIDSVSEADLERFSELWDLRGRTALFIGGLDAPKRLDFLVRAGERVSALVPGFRLLIVGDGVDRQRLLEAARQRPWLKILGPLHGRSKAVALSSAHVLAMPGRVGLISVDSFASGTPLITTDWPWHAPEFEYLRDGANAMVTPDDLSAYATALAEVLNSPELLARLTTGALRSANQYTVENMADSFLNGILSWAADSPRRGGVDG